MPVNPPDPTAFPVIKINSSTGSDTTASGAGPSTLITGVLAATHTNTTINITDAVALGGVALDGTAALWVSSSSGRQWSKITNITGTSGNWVVTVGAAYANTESGRTWGIGGKRATASGSAQAFSDWGLGWWIDQQTGETLTSSITIVCPTPDNVNPSPFYTSSTTTTWGTQPIITTATDSIKLFRCGTIGLNVANLAFKSTASTPASGWFAQAQAGKISWHGCIFDGLQFGIDGSNAAGFQIDDALVNGCEFKNCTGSGGGGTAAFAINATTLATLINCNFHDNAQAVYCAQYLSIINCVFANNTDTSTIVTSVQQLTVKNNTFYNCGATTGGAAIHSLSGTPGFVLLENNIFYDCAGYGVLFATNFLPVAFINQNNAYGGNNGGGTGLNLSGLSQGINDVTGISNPFVSGSDFGLNNTAGAGALCRGAASGVPNASANTAGDLGAIPSGGGGSGTTGATAFAF